MRILVRVLLLGAMVTLPALWARQKACLREPPIPESYTWNFRNEAVDLFASIQAGARQVENQAARLDAFTRFPNQLSWQSHAVELAEMRAQVNTLGETLCRLQVIRHVLEPWEQKAIDRIATIVTALADNTEAATQYLNENHHYLADPAYADYFDQIYDSAQELGKATSRFVEYAEATSTVERLERSPQIEGLLPSS